MSIASQTNFITFIIIIFKNSFYMHPTFLQSWSSFHILTHLHTFIYIHTHFLVIKVRLEANAFDSWGGIFNTSRRYSFTSIYIYQVSPSGINGTYWCRVFLLSLPCIYSISSAYSFLASFFIIIFILPFCVLYSSDRFSAGDHV